jgi:hypothetical protein
VREGSKAVAASRAHAIRGASIIRCNGKNQGKSAAAGVGDYTLALTATAGLRRATAQVRLIVRR